MLDQATKRRIDSARNILVGKVPDPKAQVEQITTALIYKFMDDMDKESEELGGKPQFFANGFEKYSWTKLMDRRMSGQERLDLYVQAITKMSRNPHIPQLFRNIFKDAFLPYRDAETLNLFLKEIDDFTYDHSENLGNAFEYLLSVLGSQGDAGQFRTPRHIIDFIVEVLNPQKNEKILDPACGTAGFLVSAYKYIFMHSSSNFKDTKNEQRTIVAGETAIETVIQAANIYSGDLLSPDDKAKMTQNISGYDISPDMVKLSLVNLYLHGFSNPKVFEYDTLTSDKRWDETFDVIMANPPFMTPTGGIRPHKRFQVQANRSEVLFVDYILEHLNHKGRAGIIVPEGIIFQSSNAYKLLRKLLIEDGLFAVVSLPQGVFNPYSGVKTSILFFDNQIAKLTDKLLFVKINADGFDLGAQRKKILGNDLPKATQIIDRWKKEQKINPNDSIAHAIKKSKIAESGDYNLTGDRYKELIIESASKWPTVPLGDVCKIFGGGTPSKGRKEFWNEGTIKWLSARHISNEMKVIGYDLITEEAVRDSSTKIAPKNSIIMITRVSVGKYAFADEDFAINQDLTALIPNEQVDPKYLFAVSGFLAKQIAVNAQGVGVRGVTKDFVQKLVIPLPPLPVQKEIVAELASYQTVVNGARAVVRNWRPSFRVDPKWEIVRLGDVSERVTKGTTPTTVGFEFRDSGINFVKIESIDDNGYFNPDKFAHIDDSCNEALKRSQLRQGDVLFSIAGALGRVASVKKDILPANTNQALAIITPQAKLDSEYLEQVLRSPLIFDKIGGLKVGAAQYNISLSQVSDFEIPLPPLEIQKQIVANIEDEQNIVEANKKLIKLMEQKIQDVIGEI